MSYNFKSIADVEVVAEPTESANVLIEENGVIKKAPKTAVGGGSTEWDAIIKFTHDPDNERDVCTLESGSYNSIVTKFANGEIVSAMLNMYTISGEDAGMCIQARSVTVEDWSKSQNPAFLFSFCIEGSIRPLALLSDGKCFWT
jgi:hypothetical protein